MSLSAPFKSLGHFFAVVYSKAIVVLPKIAATEKTVETVSSFLPYAALSVPAERAAYAVLGEITAVLHVGGDAAKAKLADAGLDVSVVTQVEELLKSISALAGLVK